MRCCWSLATARNCAGTPFGTRLWQLLRLGGPDTRQRWDGYRRHAADEEYRAAIQLRRRRLHQVGVPAEIATEALDRAVQSDPARTLPCIVPSANYVVWSGLPGVCCAH